MSTLLLDVLLAISALFVSAALLVEAAVCAQGRAFLSPSLHRFFLDRREGTSQSVDVAVCGLSALAMQLVLAYGSVMHWPSVDATTITIFTLEVVVFIVLAFAIYIRAFRTRRSA